MKQLLLDILPSSSPTLINFVPGRNVELLQTIKNILAGDEKEHFIFLWGKIGCGKSHLLQAIANDYTHRKLNIKYIKCDALCDGDAEFSEIMDSDYIAIDDVDRLNSSAQINLFNLYNQVRDEGHAIFLVSSSTAPAQLSLREDLVTRLRWGLVYQVYELTDEEKIQAMKNHATGHGFNLSEEICTYLLRHGQRDLPSLIAILNALDRYSLANQRQISIPVLRELMLTTA
ncbi:MAG: DnaA regulatory inactivator Hda [Nitrosospira sp.]|nr:DnaA regulatory inactivator Hda [Nitrosospira sp.]